MMSLDDRLLEEIREVNLNYLLLAQKLIQEDPVLAMVRLGVDEDTREVINNLTIQQVLKMASHNGLICGLRRGDLAYWQTHTEKKRASISAHFHSAILLANQTIEAGMEGVRE
ncbi:MAG: flagellar transcriptional regulator FlhD [Limnobacter sp.]|nr:flagellar transcriptional regulator FlhD [Limnobacter sp.]